MLYFREETPSNTMLRIDVLDALGRLLHIINALRLSK